LGLELKMISFFGHTAMHSPQFTSIFPIFPELQVDLNRKKGGWGDPGEKAGDSKLPSHKPFPHLLKLAQEMMVGQEESGTG
jgi:hypothetical protein